MMQVLAQQAQVPFESDIEHFEAQDAVNPPKPGGIVFVGSSSIVRWEALKTDFPKYNCINRGFGGSAVSDSVRFCDRIVTPYKPKIIVFFAGTNDIAEGKSADTVFDDYKQFVAKVRAKLPETKIIYISISPAPSRWVHIDDMKKANRLIKDFSHHGHNLLFMDVFDQMLTPTGGPRPELFVEDQLHMNPMGYAIWVKNLTPILAQLVK
ncbi:MAG TPA: SGNH/GDSL hydrolase family protein [Fimbriimonadaceae bacterium]